MKKKLVWLVASCLMVAALVLASCGPAAVEEEEVVVEEEKLVVEEEEVVVEEEEEAPAPGMEYVSIEGISFYYPEEWYRVGFNWEPGYEWGTCFSGGVGNEPGVFILRYALGNDTLEEFTLETKSIGYGSNFIISTPVETTVNGRPAYIYAYSGTKGGTAVQGDTMIITDGVSVWWVDCFATKAEYAQNKSNFEIIFESFIIE